MVNFLTRCQNFFVLNNTDMGWDTDIKTAYLGICKWSTNDVSIIWKEVYR